jgi:hypothetical protein
MIISFADDVQFTTWRNLNIFAASANQTNANRTYERATRHSIHHQLIDVCSCNDVRAITRKS